MLTFLFVVILAPPKQPVTGMLLLPGDCATRPQGPHGANLNSICITSPHHLQSPLGSCLAKCTLSSLPDTSDSQVENSAIKCMTQIYQLSLGWQVYKQDMDSTEIDLGHFNLQTMQYCSAVFHISYTTLRQPYYCALIIWASLVALMVKNLPAVWETQV